MSQWGPCKARDLFRALLRAGWSLKREANGSHCIPERAGSPDFGFAFQDGEGIGPRTLARIAKPTGLNPEDL